MRRFFLATSLGLLTPLLFSADAMAQTKPKPAAAPKKALYPLLPAGAGRDTVIKICGQCHTPERPATQRHDLAGWNGIIDMMVQNGAVASDDEFDQIAAYLTKNFPPGKPLPGKK